MASEAPGQPVDDTGATHVTRPVNPGASKCIGIMLTRMAAELHETARIFNQSGSKKVEVTGPMSVAGGEALRLVLDGRGYEFMNHKSDRVQIFEIGGETTLLHAELHPTLDGKGDLVGWKEKQIYAGGIEINRTLNELTNSYLMATVQKHLRV